MKNLIGLILLIVLSLAVYYVFFYQPRQKQRSDFKDFAIEDTASVTQVFISQPNGKRVNLKRVASGEWLVNGKFPARRDAVNLILTTLHDVKVRGPVSKQTFEGVVKRLATGATKVEFYTDENKPTKTWYVGGATSDRLGTYMLLEKNDEKSKKPYVTHILLERGFLGSRFFLDPVLWKDPIFLKIDPKKIQSITVKHAYDTATSFQLRKKGEMDFEIENLKTSEVFDYPTSEAILYFKEFSRVVYEYIDVDTPQEELDSVYNSVPRHEINIELEDSPNIELRTFNMPVAKDATLGGKPITYNPERMYAWSSYMKDSAHPVVQNYVFDVLVPSFEQLQSSTTVEK